MALLQKQVVVQPATAFTSSTDVSVINDYLLGVANSLCEALGLVLLPDLTKTFTYGNIYFLGLNEGDTVPLLCVCNNYSSSTYFYRSFVIRIVTDNMIQYGSVPTSTSSTSAAGSYGFAVADGLAVSFLKATNGTAFIFHKAEAVYSANSNLFLLVKATNDIDTIHVMFNVYDGTLYPSYNVAIGTRASYKYLSQCDVLRACVCTNQDALCDTRLDNDFRLNNVKLFTNKFGYAVGSTVSINGKVYFVTYGDDTCLTILLSL